MKVYELMCLLSKLPAGAKVKFDGAFWKDNAYEVEKGCYEISATANGEIVDQNENEVVLSIDC